MAVFWRVKIGWREAACALLRSRWRWIVLLVEVIWLHSYQHDLVVKMFNRTYVSISFPYIFTYFHMCSYISIYIFTCIHTFPYILAWVFYIFIHTLHGLCIFHCFFTGKSHRGHQTRARAPACTVGSYHYLLYDARWAPTTRDAPGSFIFWWFIKFMLVFQGFLRVFFDVYLEDHSIDTWLITMVSKSPISGLWDCFLKWPFHRLSMGGY